MYNEDLLALVIIRILILLPVTILIIQKRRYLLGIGFLCMIFGVLTQLITGSEAIATARQAAVTFSFGITSLGIIRELDRSEEWTTKKQNTSKAITGLLGVRTK